MNNQEIYDKAKNHLLTQRARATIDGACVYRDAEGRSCAAGCLINDEHYDPRIEYGTVREPSYGAPEYAVTRWNKLADALTKSGVPRESFPLVSELQQVHDNCLPENWEAHLRSLALRWGLLP